MSTFLMILTILIFLTLALPVMLVVNGLAKATTAALLTQETAIALIGNPKDGVKWDFSLGKVNLKLTPNFFWTSIVHTNYSALNLSWIKRFLITVIGPLSVSILFGLAAAMVQYNNNSNITELEGLNLLFFLLFGISLLSIYSETHPMSLSKTQLSNGMVIMNDGGQLYALLAIRDKATEYDAGLYLMDKGEYGQALALFNDIKSTGINNHLVENEIIRCQKMLDSLNSQIN